MDSQPVVNQPIRIYSKSSEFYLDTKAGFFSNNTELLDHALKKNNLYIQQPRRTLCKLCSTTLPSDPDFVSHGVEYSFCDLCGHLNGLYQDTPLFAESLYSADQGLDYSLNYIDSNYATRVSAIYKPKASFLLDHLPLRPQSLLDVGCGGGHFVFACHELGIDASGVDVNRVLVDYGNMHLMSNYGSNLLSLCDNHSFSYISERSADVVSALAVIEHMTSPNDFFDAFRNSDSDYILYSVPMFSFSVIIENLFPTVFPRHLSCGHTHLFTEQSLQYLNKLLGVVPVAEWRFGTDVMDLYRSAIVESKRLGASNRYLSLLKDRMSPMLDKHQSIFDADHFCSQIHCLAMKSHAFTAF